MFRNVFFTVLSGIIPLLFTGCAFIPRLEHVENHTSPPATPILADGKQFYPPATSRVIVDEALPDGQISENMQRHLSLMGTLSRKPLVTGNRVTILRDRQALQAMLEAIRGAKRYVHLETFIFDADQVGQEFAQALMEKSRQGVEVRLIYDSFGGFKAGTEFFRRMRKAGVATIEFNPLNPFNGGEWWTPNFRDHRKILIVDGKMAFTGGVNIYSAYYWNKNGKSRYKKVKYPLEDLHVKIEGPAVTEFQEIFLDTWKRKKGKVIERWNYLAPQPARGDDLVQVLASKPGQKNRQTYFMYLSAVKSSTHSVHMTSPYFVPSREMRRELMAAAKRGVDVKIIVPDVTDSRLALYAGQHHYDELLEAGVQIYQHHGGMLHSKSAVIDGVWATTGSTNLDLRSFTLNDEVNAVVISRDFAREMQQVFQEELSQSTRIELHEWNKRPLRNLNSSLRVDP